MKSVRLAILRAAAVSGVLASATVAPVSAQGPAPVKADSASKYFPAVAKHLELGGTFFQYVEVDGDLSQIGAFIDEAIKLNPAARDQLGNYSAKLVVESLGLTSVKAIGLSSRLSPGGLFHNRAILHTPEGAAGILKLLGTKASPFTALKLAPKGSDLVFEQDLTLGALLEVADAVTKSMGNSLIEQQYQLGKKLPVPGLGMNIEDLIKKIDTRITLAARFNDAKKMTIPGGPVLPMIDAVICIERLGFAFKFLEQRASEAGSGAQIEKTDQYTIIRPEAALPPEFDYYKPILMHEKATDRVCLATSLEFLKACSAGATPLSTDPSWQAASAGLPVEGNTLIYATPKFYQLIKELVQAVAVSMPAAERDAAAKFVEILERTNFLPKKATASVRGMIPEGMVFFSNTGDSHKTTMAEALAMPLFLAGAVTGFTNTIQARAASASARNEPLPEDDKVTPEQQAEYNLQQISLAAEAYFMDNTGVKEVVYEKLIETQYLNTIKPSAGESYKGLKVQRGGGKLSVQTKQGEEISHNYPPVTE